MSRWPLWCALALALVALLGCEVPAVQRQAEVQRFRADLKERHEALQLGPQPRLTMPQCEAIALRNSLDLAVQRLTLRLQDEKVRLAFSELLPKAELTFTETHRSNQPAMKFGGGSAQFEDQSIRGLSIQGVMPVLDFGTSYYGWQMAKDRRRQEWLLFTRAAQKLRRDVRVAYVQHAGAIRQERLTQTSVRAAEEVLRVGRSLEREGLTTGAETALLNAALAQARVEQSIAARRVEETRLALAQLMALPPPLRFTIDDALPALPAPPDDAALSRYEEHALLVRPELYVQDLERHFTANAVRKEFAGFFPKVDALGSFNWTSLSTAVHPSYFVVGYQVAHSLLDQGGSQIWRYQLAKKTATVEEERTLLLTLGVLYEVDLRALQLHQGRQTIAALESWEVARKQALARVLSLYKEGLESEAGTAKALAELNMESLALDRAQTEYLATWHEFEAAALPDVAAPGQAPGGAATQPATMP